MNYVTKVQMEIALRRTIDDVEWAQIEGLLRRAARELDLLVGDLSTFDSELVSDTLVDAIREDVENPGRLRMEQDGSYSYQRYAMPSGLEGRFWWPTNLLDLFGIATDSGNRLRVIPIGISRAGRGWL